MRRIERRIAAAHQRTACGFRQGRANPLPPTVDTVPQIVRHNAELGSFGRPPLFARNRPLNVPSRARTTVVRRLPPNQEPPIFFVRQEALHGAVSPALAARTFAPVR